MAVWQVLYTNATGSQRFSAVRVAESADDAEQDFIATYDISEETAKAGTFQTTQRHDPDGSYEKALVEAERRRMEHDYYRMPPKRMPWLGSNRKWNSR